jgi:hypothetical protein
MSRGWQRSLIAILIFFVLFLVVVRVLEGNDFDVVQAFFLEEFDELFRLFSSMSMTIAHVTHSTEYLQQPDEPVLLALVRTDFQLQHQPAIDADIGDTELGANALRDFDPAIVIGSLDVGEIGAEVLDEIIRVLVLRIESVRLPIIEQVPDEIAQPFAPVRVFPFGLALGFLVVMARDDRCAGQSAEPERENELRNSFGSNAMSNGSLKRAVKQVNTS